MSASDDAPGPPIERRRQIVDAAYALLDEQGLDGLTIRAVLARTGLARRAFYEQFGGKEDLLQAVFEQTIRLAAQHYAIRMEFEPDPLARLRLVVTGVVLGREGAGEATGGRLGAAMSREHLRLADARPQALEAALRPLIELIALQLAEGMVAGAVRAADPQRLAMLLYNLVSTTVRTALLTDEGSAPDRTHRAELAAELWDFCCRAIAE